MIKKTTSGWQTGSDRAALDVAIELGVPHGGDTKEKGEGRPRIVNAEDLATVLLCSRKSCSLFNAANKEQ